MNPTEYSRYTCKYTGTSGCSISVLVLTLVAIRAGSCSRYLLSEDEDSHTKSIVIVEKEGALIHRWHQWNVLIYICSGLCMDSPTSNDRSTTNH